MSDGKTENINQNLAFLEETYNIYYSTYSKSRGRPEDVTMSQRGKRRQNEGKKLDKLKVERGTVTE